MMGQQQLPVPSFVSEALERFVRYETSFNGHKETQPMHEHVEIPILLTVAYLFTVFGFPTILERIGKKCKPSNVIRAWNLFLALFSMVGATKTVPFLLDALRTHGVRWTVCTDPREGYFYNGPVGCWMLLFVLSKIPEMVDTVFLVVQRKPVIFLHWYHHLSVMLYCWHCMLVATPPALYYGAMNYVVHSLMYTYYFLMCFRSTRQQVKRFNWFITTIQLMQMVVGVTLSGWTLYLSDSERKGCFVDRTNAKLGLAMYVSYFILFAELFYRMYICKNVGKKTAAGSASSKIDSREAVPVANADISAVGDDVRPSSPGSRRTASTSRAKKQQ